MCIYEIYKHIFLYIPIFIPIFVFSKEWITYDFKAYFDIEL